MSEEGKVLYTVQISYEVEELADAERLADAAFNAVCSNGLTTSDDHECTIAFVGTQFEEEETNGGTEP